MALDVLLNYFPNGFPAYQWNQSEWPNSVLTAGVSVNIIYLC